MEYLLGLLLGLVGLLVYEKTKRKSAESLLENTETKEKDVTLQKDQIKNDALVEAEKIKQNQIKEEIKEKLNETVNIDTIINFFNKRK